MTSKAMAALCQLGDSSSLPDSERNRLEMLIREGLEPVNMTEWYYKFFTQTLMKAQAHCTNKEAHFYVSIVLSVLRDFNPEDQQKEN